MPSGNRRYCKYINSRMLIMGDVPFLPRQFQLPVDEFHPSGLMCFVFSGRKQVTPANIFLSLVLDTNPGFLTLHKLFIISEWRLGDLFLVTEAQHLRFIFHFMRIGAFWNVTRRAFNSLTDECCRPGSACTSMVVTPSKEFVLQVPCKRIWKLKSKFQLRSSSIWKSKKQKKKISE